MLQLRPTFSESWYRVAQLKPRLRPGAQVSRQFYRGERWYVVRDPAGNQFHRLSDPAYAFVGLLDGRRTVNDAWDLVGGQMADEAPTQPEVIHILSQLYAANLLETDITPDATVLLRRYKQQVKSKIQRRLMNFLFPRLPLWDPDRFLRLWLPMVRVLFSKVGAVIWLVVVISAISLVAPRMTELQAASQHAFDLQNNAENLIYLYAVFVVIKLIHELGHAFACRRFGGECHELGVMFLVFVPTPYVDASTAWGFPSKWQRIFVGAGGMIVELFVASLCAFVWAYTDAQTSPLISQLSYNAMFIASVSTVMFNANPLLRYDGYYILSDLLEIPNLYQKSSEYALGLIKRHVFRMKLPNPLPPPLQRAWLLTYAIASTIYRVFIGIIVMLVVMYKIPIIGILMAIGGLITWLAVPIVKLFRYLMVDPELHRKRTRAVVFSLSVIALVVVLIGLVKFPLHMEFTGMVEPDDPKDAQGVLISGYVKAAQEGQIVEINAADGQLVQAGQVIVKLKNIDFQHDLESAKANLQEIDARIRQSQALDQVQLRKDLADRAAWNQKLRDIESKIADLDLRAPFTGMLISPMLRDMPGAYVQRGTLIGKVAVMQHLIIRGDITQADADWAKHFNAQEIQLRLSGDPTNSITVYTIGKGKSLDDVLTVFPAATPEVTNPAMSSRAGGEIAMDPHDTRGERAQVPVLEADVKLENDKDHPYYAGQRAHVRITLDRKPLIWLWTVRCMQLIETRDTGKWL